MSTAFPTFASFFLFSYGYSQHAQFNLVWPRGCKVSRAKEAHAETTFITIIHLAARRVIAKADVAAGLPGTAGICSQKRFFHGHRPDSHNSDIHSQHHPLIPSRSNTSWNIFSNTWESKSLKGSYTKHPVNITASRAFLPPPTDTDKWNLCAWFMCAWRGGAHASMYRIVFLLPIFPLTLGLFM